MLILDHPTTTRFTGAIKDEPTASAVALPWTAAEAGKAAAAAGAGAAGATEGAAGIEGRAAALARAIRRGAAGLGPAVVDAPGVKVPTGGGEVRRTYGRKE